MSVPERRRANYWFVAACVLMMLTAGAHAFGHFSPPADAATQALVAALQGYRLDLGMEMTPSQRDVLQALSLTMAVSLLWLGVVGLVVAFSDMGRRTVQRVTAVYIVANAALVGLNYSYQLPPALVSLGVVEAVLLVAFVRAPKA